MQIHFSLSITKQLQKDTHGNRNILCDAEQVQQIEHLISGQKCVVFKWLGL